MRNQPNVRHRVPTTLAASIAAGGLLGVTRAAASEPPAVFDIRAAIAAASPGATITVPEGDYKAPIVIDKSVALVAQGRVAINGYGADGDLVIVTAPNVTLRGFHLYGTGIDTDGPNAAVSVAAVGAIITNNTIDDALLGISLNNAHNSIVRDNHIRGKDLDIARRGDAIRLWNSNDARVEDNDVDRGRDVVVWYSHGVHLTGNSVRNGRYGMHFMYAGGSVLTDNYLAENSVGVFLMYSADIEVRRNTFAHNRGPSGYGVGLKDMDNVVIEENNFVANRVGVYFDNSPQRIDGRGECHRNVFAYNDVGVLFLPAVRRNRVNENAFIENIEQIAIQGLGDFKGNEFTIAGRGNYWSDYNGFDAVGDGIGDIAYQPVSLFENLMDREPKLRMFIYSPAQQAVELAARAFPIVQPEPKISDAAPLMQPIQLDTRAPSSASAWPLSGAGAILTGTAVAVWAGVRKRRSAEIAMRVASPIATLTRGSLAVAADADHTIAPPLLRIRGLTKKFGRYVAVNNVHLDVRPGEAVALWGVNGAGKSTIIKCILGLHSSHGDMFIGDCSVRRQGKAARRLVGYVSQELAFYDDLSAYEVAVLFARIKRVAIGRAAEVLMQVGLAEHAGKRVAALSGGMKQRLALAVALLSNPPLLLLDEPTSNLDAAARRQFLALLDDLKRAGKTILFTTHRAEEVAQLADRLVVLERGKIRCEGVPRQFDDLIGVATILRIMLPAEMHGRAEQLLAQSGLRTSCNHTAICVRVSPLRKAEPLAILARAGIPVENFELESENGDAC